LTGSTGPTGPTGPTGTPDPSNFYDKAESDARFVQVAPAGASGTGVYTNHVAPTPSVTATVLSLPEGFTVTCFTNNSTASSVDVTGPATGWVGNVQYNTGATMTSALVSNTFGGGAAFGSVPAGTAHYQVMNTTGSPAPTRVWTITVIVLRSQMGGASGPQCFAEAIAGPA
jgi:hypothetical protein